MFVYVIVYLFQNSGPLICTNNSHVKMVFQTSKCNYGLSSRIFQLPNIHLGLSASCGTTQLLLQKSQITCGIKMVQK